MGPERFEAVEILSARIHEKLSLQRDTSVARRIGPSIAVCFEAPNALHGLSSIRCIPRRYLLGMDGPLSKDEIALIRPAKRVIADAALALLLTAGYASPLFAPVVLMMFGVLVHPREIATLFAVGAFLACCALIVFIYRAIQARGRGPFLAAAEILVLVLLPIWGLIYSHMAHPSCVISSCEEGTTAFRPLAEPEVFGLIALHVFCALAYLVSRRRPGALYPQAEILVHASLIVGMVFQSIVAIHFGPWVAAGLVLPPIFIPCLAPVLTVVLYGIELHARLSRRGSEAQMPSLSPSSSSAYLEDSPHVSLPPPPSVHRPLLARALLLSPALMGIYAVIHAIWLGQPAGALQVFTRTCKYTLSTVPLEVIPQDCHYLCTVAAEGHTWLVRPLRVGRRRGVPILVNRQLAVANAFEDLLHERWPRFGALARRIYDRLGLPVSRYLRRKWAADLTYLAMKPLEWGFYLVLLLLDRKEPEARIDRMYR